LDPQTEEAGFIANSSGAVYYDSPNIPEQEVVMLTVHVALVSDTDAVSPREVTRVAAALDRQVTRDFDPLWGVRATVDPFFSLEDIPVGYWRIILRDGIKVKGADGFHKDRFGQPFALMALTDSWSLTASHECLEMLADPFGDRMVPGPAIEKGQGRVSYLVEVCDPPESEEFAYTVNDVLVSDFITPQYFDPVKVEGVRYSFTGAVEHPRQVLEGGYLSWRNQTNEHIEQLFVTNGKREVADLGVWHPSSRSVREFVDRETEHPKLENGLSQQNERLKAAVEAERDNKRARQHAAELLHEDIEMLL
jgi:hypothetical protein